MLFEGSWIVFRAIVSQFVRRIFGQIFDHISDQVFDQMFGQGFDQGKPQIKCPVLPGLKDKLLKTANNDKHL